MPLRFRWFRDRYHVTRIGFLFFGAVLLVGAAALLTGSNLLFLVLASLLATLLVSGLIGRLGLAGLELELLLPEHISAGQRTVARLRLRNLKSLFPSFSIAVSGPAILDRPLYFPLLHGGAGLEEPVYLSFPTRGYHVQNLFALTTRFPFGFVENTARVTIRRETLVYPSLQGSADFLELANALGNEVELQARGQGPDFFRVRPYQSSESARHLDWRSTAHTGQMQLREYAASQRETLEIYFDQYIEAGADEWFETAVECCAFVVWELAGRGIPLRVHSQDFEGADVYTILKFLALVAPREGPRLSSYDAPLCHLLLSCSPSAAVLDLSTVVRVFAPGERTAGADDRTSA